ncbi:hypothetical protein [Halovivax limisalsi]|uniref:hypothetical protein n=1 Tax=Halovivax limisalsi TaxID=1453760 RepID=UPI001FFD08D2|nr:hypothetical protein [Halovivax limisalsi]
MGARETDPSGATRGGDEGGSTETESDRATAADWAHDGQKTIGDGEAEADSPPRCCSRRTVLGAVAGTTGIVAPGAGSAAAASEEAAATLSVRLYAGPTPVYGRLRDGPGALGSDWTSAHEAAATAIEAALGEIKAYASDTGREWLDVAVDRGSSVGPPFAVPSPLDAVVPAERLYDRFRGAVESAGDADAPVCHLLLWWGPFDYQLGYGRVLPDAAPVGMGDQRSSFAVVNVGATEGWDGRAVTKNMAIHEALHAFLSEPDAEAVAGAPCEHALGSVAAPEPDVRVVSPMATAYAGRSERIDPLRRLGGGLAGTAPGDTRWPGRGCVERRPARAEPESDGAVAWRHETALSAATTAAVCRYADRVLR